MGQWLRVRVGFVKLADGLWLGMVAVTMRARRDLGSDFASALDSSRSLGMTVKKPRNDSVRVWVASKGLCFRQGSDNRGCWYNLRLRWGGVGLSDRKARRRFRELGLCCL